MGKFLYLFMSIFTTLSLASTPESALDLSIQNENIGKSLFYIEDESAKMSFEQIKNLPQCKFKQVEKNIDSHLFTKSAIWYTFNVYNKEDKPLKKLIVFGIPWLDSIKLHIENEDAEVSTYEGGDTLPYKNRTIKHNLTNFEHEFKPGYSKIYVQIKTRDPFVVPISIVDRYIFLENETSHSSYTSFIYGIIIAMLVYNLVLFLTIKSRHYAFYVLYLGLFLTMHASYNCYTFKLFFSNTPELQNWAESTSIYLFSISGLLFAQSFLNLKNHFPRINIITNYLIIFFIATMVITFFIGYHYHVMFAIAFTLIFSLYALVIAFYSLINKNYYARFFLLGTTAGLVGTSITSLSVMAIIPYSNLGFHAVDYGMIVDTMLLSLALVDKMKIIQNEKMVAQNEAKMAMEAKQAKGEFLSNMSHEIRTPMNAILGFIHVLEKNITDEKNLSYIKIIHSNSQTLLHLIDDILDLSKIENDKLIIEKHPFNPHNEFECVGKLFEAISSEKSIQLFSEISLDVPHCLEGDSIRIKQIMFNFLSNAFKFTPENKKIFIKITYENENLLISVKDEGIGISAEAQRRIFNAFEQADNTTSRKYGGTGLGLSISLKLAKLMSGEIFLTSTDGAGSTFTLSLPLSKCANNEIVSIHEDTHTKEDFNYDKLCGHVLVVEDNKMNQTLMKILLDEYGLDSTIVGDGVEALDIFKSSKFDLILMDDSMPNMSGIEALKIMRQHENKNGLNPTPIVALTANAMEEDRARFFDAGADDFISKPIDMAKLNKVLERYLS